MRRSFETKLNGADAVPKKLMIDTNPAVARQQVVLTARLASVAAACHQLTPIMLMDPQ